MKSKLNFSRNRINVMLTYALVIALSTATVTIPTAIAANSIISTEWSIANGAESPPVFLDGTGFDPDNDKFDFTVDMGTTGLEYDSVAFVNSSLMRFNFHGKASTGTITIQANTSAFTLAPTGPSNTISIIVPPPFLSQVITFVVPKTMTVKDVDQSPSAISDSGLTVVLTSDTPSVCTIDFLKIHAVAAGTCSITANAAGNSVYSQAVPVVRNFKINVLVPEIPGAPALPAGQVTNLGSTSYDPKNASGSYVAVLVAADNADPKNATLVKFLAPPDATKTPVVFLISSYSSSNENSAGYFVARIKSIDAQGNSVSSIRGTVEINIPAGAADSIPAWSLNGKAWYKLKKMNSEVLPADYHAGYFVESDGRIAILTDYLMLFGHRKVQEEFRISSPVLLMNPGSVAQVKAAGGSGNGQISFFSRSLDVCTVTASGLMTGINDGKCIIAATKEASGQYLNAISSAISVYVHEDTDGHHVDGSDPNHDSLCQELSYTLLKTSSLVYVSFCREDAAKSTILEVGTKSTSGKWSYKVVAQQNLDLNGVTIFNLNYPLKGGQVVRVKVDSKIQIATTIRTN